MIDRLTEQAVDLTKRYTRYSKISYHKPCKVPSWLTVILAIVMVIGIIPVFTRDASLFSRPVIFSIAAWLFAKIICITVNISRKVSTKKKNKMREQIEMERQQVYTKKSRAESRLYELER
jgi:hypothetical protein